MGTSRAFGRLGAWLTGALAAILVIPATSLASFHLMDVREVFPGSAADPGQDYVELQMYASGQKFVAGHTLTVYGPTGLVAAAATFTGDVPNGRSQDTILIGAKSQVLGVAPDLVAAGLTAIDPAGGAVCWATDQLTPVDCVSWGSFSGTTKSPSGTPAPAIADGSALRRTIEPGCPTLLEAADDTDDSATDFLAATPDPRNNSTPPSEKPCLPPDTRITSGPSGRTRDRTPTFAFKAIPAQGARFRCKLDSSRYRKCSSPYTLPRLSLGRHTFRVRAANRFGADPSPASRRFKVVRRG